MAPMSRLRRMVLCDIHLNPVKAGWVAQPEDWKWSSVHDYAGTWQAPEGPGNPIPVDRIPLPTDPQTRI